MAVEQTFWVNCNPSLLSSMVCDSVGQHELLALIATLDNSKSPGHDNIGARLIKEVKHYIVEPLLHYYQPVF